VQAAKEGLRQQVSQLAIGAAEQILRQEVDENRHREVLDNLDRQLG
jgi:F-type H+-transporting ATPase subunit b